MNYENFPVPLLDDNKELPDKEMILARFRTALYDRLARSAAKTKVAQSVQTQTVNDHNIVEPDAQPNQSLFAGMDQEPDENSSNTADLLSGFDD